MGKSAARWLKGAAYAAVAIAVAAVVVLSPAGDYIRGIEPERLAGWVRSFGWFAWFVAAMLILVQTLVPAVPFVLLAGANVFVFGLAGGFAISYVSVCLSAVAAFAIARVLGRQWVESRYGHKPAFARMWNSLERNGFIYVLTGRLIIFVPSSVVNYAAGASRMSLRSFALATVIGKLPVVFAESLLGHGMLHMQEQKGLLVLLLALLGLLAVLGQSIHRKLIAKED